jgi:hypothetical protein
VRRFLTGITPVFVAAGCSWASDDPAQSTLSARDCIQAWNSAGNAANRSALVRTGFRVGRASEWQQIADFAAGETPPGETRSFGCSYLFHSDRRYTSFSGRWQGHATILWDRGQTLRGRWGVEQQQNTSDDIRVLGVGKIAERRAHLAPSARAPRLPVQGGPPAAWVETRRSSRWLALSTFCGRTGCVDYVRHRCDGGATRGPMLLVDRGELVRLHLVRERPPRMLLLTFRGRRRYESSIVLRSRVDPVWRAAEEGAFEILALEARGRTSTYVGCLRFSIDSVPAASRPASITQCGRAVAADLWVDGTVGSTYHSSCYRWVLDQLSSHMAGDPRPQLERRLREARLREDRAR